MIKRGTRKKVSQLIGDGKVNVVQYKERFGLYFGKEVLRVCQKRRGIGAIVAFAADTN
jgi:fibrillarin-like rRNA methylase